MHINIQEGNVFFLISFNLFRLKRRVLKQMYMATLGKFQPGGASKPATGSSVQGAEEETRPLLSSKY